MKSLILIALVGMLSWPAFAQEDTVVAVPDEVSEEVISEDENSGETLVIDENKDTTRIRVGKKGIIIIEGDNKTQVNIEDIAENEDFNEDINRDFEDEDFDKPEKTKKDKFKPHWASFEVGLNNYVNADGSMSLDNTMGFMDLNTGRSWNFNLNFLEYGFGLGTDKIGLVTGLGFEWNNYHFDNANNIMKDASGVIAPYDLAGLNYTELKKNRLQSLYLRAPLLLEVHIPTGKHSIHLAAGPVAGVKLASNTKIVYKANGDNQKLKDKDDYNLNALRYGFTARLGYRGLNLFANYYMTPLFEASKGPELYPFSVGLTLLEF